MYYLQTSVWYDLEYSFCQTDTFPDLDAKVISAHGVCSVCAVDWLVSKIAGAPFTFSEFAIRTKVKQFDTADTNFSNVYYAALRDNRQFPNVQQGPTTTTTLNFEGGQAVAATLRNHAAALIHVGQGLSRTAAGGSHVLAVYRHNGKYYMFDSNFGSYRCSYERGVANWFNNIVNRARPAVGAQPAKGAYSTWAKNAVVLSYPV